MNVIFLGGIATESLVNYIRDRSIGPMQNAADVLQKNYLYGLSNAESIKKLEVVNLPYAGTYPKYFKDKCFEVPVKIEKIYGTCDVYNYSFNNIKGLKSISRLFTSLKGILKLKKKGEEYNIICYSMHLPFLLSCYFSKLLFRRFKYYIIITDLPEYMSQRSWLAKLVLKVLDKLSYYIVNKSDGVSFITSQMAERFNPGLRSVVIEGISSNYRDNLVCPDNWWPDFLEKKNYSLYTGTLDRRYGIRDLVDAFTKINNKDEILLICGDGDDRSYVENMSLLHQNIKYMGQIQNDNVKILQKNAKLLINPRSNDGEYTKYSFPSKTIEYMNAGVPVLMYQLDGIPQSYNDYYFKIDSKDKFVDKLNQIFDMSNTELNSMGSKAKEFIAVQGSPDKQVRKLISLLSCSQ